MSAGLMEPQACKDETLDDDPPHAMPARGVVRHWSSDAQKGLSGAEAERRLATFGPNELAPEPARPWWAVLVEQLKELVVLLLLVAAAIAISLGEWVNAVAILTIVGLNAGLGIYQHWKTEHALAALSRLSAPLAKVIRDGVVQRVPAAVLVPGDRIELEAGDHVPADARLLHGFGLQTQESALTGESTPVTKDPSNLLPGRTPLGDRSNMVFTGTVVTAGKASALVIATGMKTELGRVAGLLQDRSAPATPLQQRIHQLGIVLVGWFVLVIAIIAGLQLARGVSALETLHLSISLAVAAVPEGLPAVLAITLAFGAQRLAHRQALVRQLSSVETLGSVSAICTDKTGTLTRNEMTVREIHTLQDTFDVTGAGYSVEGSILRRPPANDHRGGLLTEEALQGLTIGCWCNHAQVVPRPHQTGFWEVVGDPTEAALLVAAHKAGVSRSTELLHVEHEIPFDSQRKAMSVIVSGPMRSRSVFMKGAVEVVLSACTRGLKDGKVGLLTEGQRQQILRANDEMASRALRVLAVAYRDELAPHESSDVERDLIFVGLFGMIDPPREEAKAAIATCHQAGIRPIMITGDHPATALAIGRELGLPATKADVMEGRQIDLCSDEHFEDRVARVSIFARVSAEHKLRIIQSLQRQGGVVAMTGDGVNDAPAVKAADIGIAMGNTGTDVTKEAASLVLTNDNFATIVEAVREGRAIYDNILKFIHYLLAGNVGKILFMFVAVLFGLPAPLLAMQILWLNVVTDGLPALALGLDRGEAGVMRRMPRRSNDPLLGVHRGLQVMFHGTLAAGVAFAGFWTVYRGDSENLAEAQLVAFCILGFAQLAYAFTCRSQAETIWQLRPGSNPHLLVAAAVSLLLLLAVVLIPALRGIFGIEALPQPWEWGFIVVLSLLPALTIESIKGSRQLAAKLSERATR